MNVTSVPLTDCPSMSLITCHCASNAFQFITPTRLAVRVHKRMYDTYAEWYANKDSDPTPLFWWLADTLDDEGIPYLTTETYDDGYSELFTL